MAKWKMQRALWAAVVGGVLCSASVSVAQEEEIDAAERLEAATTKLEALRYDEARAGLYEVVRSGTADPETLAQAYFQLGVVEAALNDGTSATDAFYLALMVQPSVALGLGGSPKIQKHLNAARDRVIRVGALEAQLRFKKGVLSVNIKNDPVELVKGIQVSMSGGDDESGSTRLELSKPSIEVPEGVESVEVALLDSVGNQIRVLELDPSEGTEEPEGLPTSEPFWRSVGLWAGVAGLAAAGGVYFSMEASDRGDRAASAEGGGDEVLVQRYEDEQARFSNYSLIGYSLAGAAAVAAGAVWYFDGSGDSGDEAEDTALVPAVGPSVLGASLVGSF